MNPTESQILNTFEKLTQNPNYTSKKKLIDHLARSVEKENESKSVDFYKSFGAFGSENSPEEIIKEIKSNRKFSINS